MSVFTFGLIKSGYLLRVGHNPWPMLDHIHKSGFHILKEEPRHLTVAEIGNLYRDHIGMPYWHALAESVNGGVHLFVLYHPVEAVARFRELMGPSNSKRAAEVAPNSLRAIYGNPESGADNAVHGSDSEPSMLRELSIMWPEITPDSSGV